MSFLHLIYRSVIGRIPIGIREHVFYFLLASIPLLNLLSTNSELIGYEGAEVYGHAWVHWWRGEALFEWPPGTTLALGMQHAPAIDPLVICVSGLLGKIGGVVFGYNAAIWLGIYLAAFGGGRLSKSQGAPFWLGAIVLAWSPAYLGSIQSGLSEDAGLGFLAFVLVYLQKQQDWWKAGICLALSVWSGLVLGWLTWMCAAWVSIGLLYADRHRFRSLVGSAVLGAILCVPILWPHLSRIAGEGHRSGMLTLSYEPMWRINPWKQIDLLSLITPGQVDVKGALLRMHPAYLGLVCWFLAFRSRAWPWMLLAGIFVALALSEQVSVMGSPDQFFNPIAWLWHQFPFANRLNHHGRAMMVVSVLLVVLVSKGVPDNRYRSILGWMIAMELFFCSPIGMPLATTEPLQSSALQKLRSVSLDGRVIALPAFGPGVSFQKPLWWQRIHQKPLMLNPNRPDVLMRSKDPFIRWLIESGMPQKKRQVRSSTIADWPTDIAAIIVEKSHSEPLRKRFGIPHFQDEKIEIWIKEQ